MYLNRDDDRIRNTLRSMCALAFVPAEDVPAVFDSFFDDIPEEFIPVAEYFEVTYIHGKPARGRRKTLPIRYAPAL